MKKAMAALSAGNANIPERIHLDSSKGTTLVMPGNVDDGDQSALVVKVVSIFNDNDKRDLPNILGVVNVLDPETGKPLAIMDGAMVTAIRTAATSAAATDLLAKEDATTLAIIGSGAQARAHFRAVCCVRKIKECFFYAPRKEKAAAMIGELKADASMDQSIELIIAQSSTEATSQADIVCTATNSSRPVIEDSAIKDGCHINAIGSYKPSVVEIPAATVVRSRVFVDELKHAIIEAGDLVQPIKAGLFSVEQSQGNLANWFWVKSQAA